MLHKPQRIEQPSTFASSQISKRERVQLPRKLSWLCLVMHVPGSVFSILLDYAGDPDGPYNKQAGALLWTDMKAVGRETSTRKALRALARIQKSEQGKESNKGPRLYFYPCCGEVFVD